VTAALSRVRSVLPAVLFAVGFLLLWELFVVTRDIKPYLLPAPSLIWDQIVLNFTQIRLATVATGLNAFAGLVAGTAFGVGMAFVASRFRVLREMMLPIAAAMAAMPIIALVPMFNNMFTSTSTIPRRLVVAIVVFFPIFINTLRGLTQVDPIHRELMHSFAASEGVVLRKVRLPNSLPFFFTGLRLAASLCVIAAVVAEYFGGLQTGLGSRITSAAANSAYGRAWAYVAASCALGLLFYVSALIIERLAMPWQANRRST
jgi:NitT/TauT family transport system permease protein